MMQNAMLKTKREGGQIFRLVGLVGSIWHPKLQLCLEGASFSNRHSLCQLLSFWSFSFSLILTFFPPYPCFSLNTSSPPHVPLRPDRHSSGCQNRRASRHSNLFYGDVSALNKMAIVLPDVFFFPPKYFPPACSRANIVSRCDGAAVDSGPKQNGG